MIALRPHQYSAKIAMLQHDFGIINHPTGTGKTYTQAATIADIITKHKSGFCISVVLAPRIILADQLQKDVFQFMMLQDNEPMTIKVHSGKKINVYDEEQLESFEQGDGGTSVARIVEHLERAKRMNVPVIIVATYHSSMRWIEALKTLKMKAEIVCCDEAHYLVRSEFNQIIQELALRKVTKKCFCFTATLRETHGEGGLGMNNEEVYGKIIHQLKPIAAILAGEIVRPRMHFIKVENQGIDGSLKLGNNGNNGNKELWPTDVVTVIEGFNEHRALVKNMGAKLLVVTRGSEHLNYIVSSEKFKQMVKTNKRMTVFDITSAYGARINGAVVEREFFLSELKRVGKDPLQEAIIFHYDILAEGIDVPGISGVLPFRDLGKAKFLQNLGRGTRLQNDDREEIYAGKLDPQQFTSDYWVKPYCWLIVPYYGELGNDLGASLKGYIAELRDFNFNPAEDVFTLEAGGKKVPVSIEGLTRPTKKSQQLIEFMEHLVHELETEDDANKLKARLDELVEYEVDDHERFLKSICVF